MGALIVYAFNSGLSLAGVSTRTIRILAIGVLVIVAVSIDQVDHAKVRA